MPNYATRLGFEFVSVFDYLRYKEGYCLSEYKILDKEELYKRAIGKYLDKELILTQMINEYRANTYGSSWRSKYEIAYYELENINLSNWFEVLQNYYKEGKSNEEIFINELKAKKTDPKKYLKLNFKDMSAGFDRPIIRISGDNDGIDARLMLDNFMLLNKNNLQINHYQYLFDNIDFNQDIKKFYQKNKQATFVKKDFFYKIDNCGNINFDIYKGYIESREVRGG